MIIWNDMHLCARGLIKWIVYLDGSQVSQWGHHHPHAISSPYIMKKARLLVVLDVSCQKMAGMGGGEGLPEATESYQKREDMGRGKRLTGAAESCRKLS
jgi:hypothetical protein